jgi:hypothetical protein
MAKSGTSGGARVVPDPKRPQKRDPRTGLWTRRDTSSGRFVDAKKRGGSLRSVVRER